MHKRKAPQTRAAVLVVTVVGSLVLWAGPAGGQREPRRRLQAVTGSHLVLSGGTLIDGTGGPPIADGVLVIQGDRIVAAGRRADVAVPTQARVIDVSGATVLPGFINAHVHSGYRESRLERWAWEGVTTVRDLAGPRDYRTVAELGRNPHLARLVAAGPFITAPNGYPIVPWGSPSAIPVSSVAQARMVATQLIDEGAGVIKIAIETGQEFGRVIPTLSLTQARAIVEVAHARGVPVSAHVTRAVDLPRALDAGVDDIAHMVVDTISPTLLARLIAQGVLWVPTLELWNGVGQGRDVAAIRNLSQFVAAGGAVALGTDYAGYSTPFQLGIPILEMELMVQAGMSPMQVIVAGTSTAARACGRAADLGALEVGRIADVLVVRGDPLADIHALGEAILVLRGGVVIRDETGQ